MGKISFKYNGKRYEVDMKAYDRNRRIVLPDGTVLEANDWKESKTMSPKQQGFKVVNRISSQDTPERIAELTNGIVATLVNETPVLDLTHVSAGDIEAALFKAYPDEVARLFYAKVAEQLAGNRWYPHTLFLTLALTSMTQTAEQLPPIAGPLPQWTRFVPDIFDLRSYLIVCLERQHLKEVRQQLSMPKPSLSVSEHMLDWAEGLSLLVDNSAFLEAFRKLWYDYQEAEKQQW